MTRNACDYFCTLLGIYKPFAEFFKYFAVRTLLNSTVSFWPQDLSVNFTVELRICVASCQLKLLLFNEIRLFLVIFGGR